MKILKLTKPLDKNRAPRPFERRESLPQFFYPFLSPISDSADEAQVNLFTNSLSCKDPDGNLAGIYIHIPFCRNFCVFCPIYKTKIPDEAGLAAYVEQLIREMDIYADLPYTRSLTFGAVYIGGGSPSSLPLPLVQRLLIAVRERFTLVDDCEITVEGEVRTLNEPGRLDGYKHAGCNRISFGVQSFDPFVRRKSNLRPRLEEIKTLIKNLHDTGYPVNMDMMYGLPGQTLEVWKTDLALAVDLGADQIDFYDTITYPNTKLFKLRHKYKSIMAGESEKIAMVEHLLNFLPQQGLDPRINHIFSREGNRFDWVTFLYSDGIAETLAVGDSAIGYLNGRIYRNASPIDAYMAWKGTPRLPVRLLHTLTPEERSIKNIQRFCRFLQAEKDQLGTALLNIWRPVFDDLISRGVMGENSRRLWLTKLGQIWYDNVFLAFLPPEQRFKMWKIMY
jgi:oxygen-independent coproporphyrinogen-3 oxidase